LVPYIDKTRSDMPNLGFLFPIQQSSRDVYTRY
jgi:hypothetical protein